MTGFCVAGPGCRECATDSGCAGGVAQVGLAGGPEQLSVRQARLHGIQLVLKTTEQITGTLHSNEARNEGRVLSNDVLNTFYLWLYSVGHLNQRTKEPRNQGNVLFNDALNTFYLWLYSVGHSNQ